MTASVPRITWDPRKEAANRRKHGLGFDLAKAVLADPLNQTSYDRFENGEHRWQTIAVVRSQTLMMIHTFPDGDESDWVHVIGLRVATVHERRTYERGTT